MKKLFSYAIHFAAVPCVSLLFSCHADLEMPESPDVKFGAISSPNLSSSKLPSSSSGVETKQQLSPFTDPRDKNVYDLVSIGNQIWMAKNLNFKTETGSKCYDCEKYGRLYNWETAKNAACPSGFHLPERSEWEKITNLKNASKDLKSKTGWGDAYGGNDEYGFAALPGGSCTSEGDCSWAGLSGAWWTSTDIYKDAYTYNIDYDDESSYSYNNKSDFYSVRCVKNN